MKKIFVAILAIVAVAGMAAAETIEKEFDASKANRLYMDLDAGGAVYISGWDKDKVQIKVHVFKIDPDRYDLSFDADGSAIIIESDYSSHRNRERHGGQFEYDIRVPSKFNLDIQTTGGEIGITGVTGDINGKTMGGDLDFSKIKGDIDFETMGGAVKARDIEGRLDLTTMGGNITVLDSKADGQVYTYGGKVTIENVDGNLKGKTLGGNVTYNNVSGRSDNSRGGDDEVRVSSMGGEIRIDKAPKGATLETMGGGIDVNSAAEFVKAETMGGDINIKEVDGWVDVSTMGGDVTVNMVGDPSKGRRDVTISSLGGDIELTVPAGLSMDFDIDIEVTKKARRDYSIISDFDIKEKRTDRWEGSWGSKRKHIYGTGSVDGGKNLIKIDTINGDVYIKRGK